MKNQIYTVLLLAFINGVVAADWPRWRGVNHDDVSTETGLLQSWPSAGPKRIWLSRDIGIGYSAPSISDGRLFILGTKNGKEQLFAKSVKSGKTLWEASLNDEFSNNWGNGPRGAATVDGDMVFALGAKGGLICVNAISGKLIWKVDLVEELGGKAPYWGYSESVLIEGDLVICTPGGNKGTLAALDKKTGKVKWRSADWTDGAQYASPVPATLNKQRQIVQLTQKTLAGISVKDGSVLWKNAWPGRTAVIPTPIIQGQQVYISSGYGVGCRKITIGSDNRVEEIYSNKNMKNHHGGVLLKDGHLYGYSDGRGWTCQNLKTGEVVWDSKKLGKGCVFFADNRLYCMDEGSGTVVLADASTKGWEEYGRFKLKPQTELRKPAGRIWTHPVVANGILYLRDQELLFAFDVKR